MAYIKDNLGLTGWWLGNHEANGFSGKYGSP